MDLAVVVTAATEVNKVVVGEVLHERTELWLWAEEVLADVGAAGDDVLLELAVDGRVHLPNQVPAGIICQECIPLAAPDHLDDVPSSAAEEAL